MGKPDVAVKNWLSHKERFADLFNGCVFGGKQVVLPEELTIMNIESDIIARDKSDKRKDIAVQRFRDIVMRWKNNTVLMLLACESQDKVHYAMPVKNMLYDSLSYTNQMKDIWNGLNDEERRQINEEEFFSRFRKEDKLYPVITLVFYYGTKEWDGSIELYDMFQFDSSADKELLKNYVPNYRINLVEPAKIEELSLFKTDLHMIFGVLKCRQDKKKIIEYMDSNRDYFNSVDIETAQAMAEMLHYRKVMELVQDDREEACNMCKALEDLYNDGV
ncbi:MAG: Rpn family recombination-promoting nuclease/putative transposase, partial [Lachnospiraceae bacterium]|nr:Rpn family recombination-promoting nuclease/putative transposase [Lachnospiraceae bacterium]